MSAFYVIRMNSDENDGVAVDVRNDEVQILYGETDSPVSPQTIVHLDHGQARELAEAILEELDELHS